MATFIELQLEDYLENAKPLYINHMQIKDKQNLQDHLLTKFIEIPWSIQNPTPEEQQDIGDKTILAVANLHKSLLGYISVWEG